jgi:hypothetical protein
MSELRERMIRDLRLAGLGEGTGRAYPRSVRQLAAYYMLPLEWPLFTKKKSASHDISACPTSAPMTIVAA